MEYYRHQRNDEPPYGKRAEAYYERIFQTYDIAESEDSGSGVDLEHELRLLGYRLSEAHDACGEVLVPQPERGYDEVIQSSNKSREEQRLCLIAALCAAHQYLRRGCGFRERILPVHVAHEIFAERNEEQNADDASEE